MTPERLGEIARKAWKAAAVALAVIYGLFVIPFWVVGFLAQSAWMGLRAGMLDAQNLDRSLKP